MDYESDLTIDETILDVEWLEQPQLMMKYSRVCADAEAEKDRAKEKFDLAKAELDKDIRSNPDDFGITKITDKVVEMTIPMQDDYKDASEAFIKARHAYAIAIGAVKAFDARKTALENLVKLHGQQYFAGPKVPHNLSDERKKKKVEDAEVNSSIRISRRTK